MIRVGCITNIFTSLRHYYVQEEIINSNKGKMNSIFRRHSPLFLSIFVPLRNEMLRRHLSYCEMGIEEHWHLQGVHNSSIE